MNSSVKKNNPTSRQKKNCLDLGVQSALILEAVKIVSQSKSSLDALWAFRIPTCLASFHTTSSYQKKTEMNAKSGPIPGEPDETQREESSKTQIRGPPIPRVQEWSSPHRAKMEFNITDPPLRPWGEHLLSSCLRYGSGKGKAPDGLPRSPRTNR